jgi:hypothetical protein
MRHKEKSAIALLVVALVLILAQAAVWRHSVSRAHSETAKENREEQHPPTELPGLAGTGLLVLAGVLLSIPRSSGRSSSDAQ